MIGMLLSYALAWLWLIIVLFKLTKCLCICPHGCSCLCGYGLSGTAQCPPFNCCPPISQVNVWDVVDEGFSKSIVLPPSPNQPPGLLCDAKTVHVYRNTHAVIFLVDVTRQDTFVYVRQELERVQPLPVPFPTHVANPLGMQYFCTLTIPEKFFECWL